MDLGTIGDVLESRAEITIKWKIQHFSSLSQDIDSFYSSPKFYFSGASWKIHIYPNGESSQKSEDWIGLFIRKMSDVCLVEAEFTLSLQSVGARNYLLKTAIPVFGEMYNADGWWKFISKSDLMKHQLELIPSDCLTIICTLKNKGTNPVNSSLFSRLQKLSDDFKEIYQKAEKPDFKVKVEEQNIGAHRLVFEARSPVFAAMLNHDTEENRTGEISIVDMDKTDVEALLSYIYSGNIDKLSTDSAWSLYAAAEKYDLKDLKMFCSQIIIRNLTVETVCNVITFSELYQDKEMGLAAKEYFKENAAEIVETNSWKAFMEKNLSIGVDLLTAVAQARPNIKTTDPIAKKSRLDFQMKR